MSKRNLARSSSPPPKRTKGKPDEDIVVYRNQYDFDSDDNFKEYINEIIEERGARVGTRITFSGPAQGHANLVGYVDDDSELTFTRPEGFENYDYGPMSNSEESWDMYGGKRKKTKKVKKTKRVKKSKKSSKTKKHKKVKKIKKVIKTKKLKN